MVAQDEAVGWVALRAGAGIGDVIGRQLVERFGSPRAALATALRTLADAGFGAGVARGLAAARAGEDAARLEVERTSSLGARIVPLTAPEYPTLLRHLADAPLYLVAHGEPLVESPALAVVGARHASPYGREVATRLAEDLALAGVTVVSGLARGVDGAAHTGALRAGGRTIGVLGSGIDVVYPPEHRALADAITRTGTLLSEQPLGAAPHASHFPKRNRILAGMTHGTIVVEAADGSGSLITARLALEYGREVFAVPGRIDSPLSAGTHRLIQEGAKLVMGVDDVVCEIAPALRARAGAPLRAATAPAGEADERIVPLLVPGPLSIDQLIRESGLTAAEVLVRVLDLELRGVVRQLPGHYVERVQ